MNTFKDSELILVGGRELPTISGRVRLLHETYDTMAMKTEIIDLVVGSHAVVRGELVTPKGTFTAHGTATSTRDAKLANSLLELAETRAWGRCCRLAGLGCEVGVEEMDDAAFVAGTVPDARGSIAPAPLGRINPGDDASRRPRRTGTPATAAQQRCVAALAGRLHIDPGALVARFVPGVAFEDLSLADASRVIDAAKRNAGTHGNNGAGGTNGEGR